jgi:type IV pilus assembly protein PilO
MNLRIEKKNIIILTASVLLAVLMYVGAYFLYLSPLQDSLALKESQLQSEQQLNTTIETRLASADSNDISTVELQKMLPVDPLIEQLVLDLEKAEIISNSYITSMEFNNDASQDAALSAETQAQGTETITADDTDNSSIRMPEGVSKTTVTITVESDNYFDLERFIETLEKLKRVVVVDSISFSGPEEIDSLSDEASPIIMTLTANSFYLSGLDNLKGTNPKVETPEPANKRNPFPTFGDYSEENLTEEEGAEDPDGIDSDESLTEEDSNEQ